MIVFTGGDEVADDINGMQGYLKEQVRTASEDLKEVLYDANNRYCMVSNKGTFETRRQHAKVVLSMIQDVTRRNSGEYFTNEMFDHINVSNQRAQHPSNIAAVKETRQAIVEGKEEPGFFNTLKNTAKKYILPVLSTVLGVGVSVAVGAVAKRCSVM
ncbi:hypothetical protein C0Q70_17279 [Pomacea canaliculata]|uniref:AIG1-type G domain-containing protein n=1 Tax=Pomacea canaliculata TaxID=400727 RepID=A0A2T7NS78_POMCA|nr:hypothetical protein C0Q70_17279 [Pomacea canaliculata]